MGGGRAPDRAAEDRAADGRSATGRRGRGRVRTAELFGEGAPPARTLPEQTRVDRTRLDQSRLDQSRLDQSRLDQSRLDQSRADQVRADQIRSGRTTAARTRAAGRMTARQTAQVLRDFQRSKVYEAEHLVQRIFDRSAEFPVVEVAGSHLVLPVERRFGSIEAVQHYVDQVLALRWVRNTWRRASTSVTVRERAGGAQAHYLRPGAIMAVPGHRAHSTWALRELVILHEIAHHLADTIEIAHGAAFVDRLLTLVDGVIGPEAALLLRVNMVDVGVRVG